ncbi:hypothetical protein [Chryseobacterium sp. SIMBA_028]|uniref:hypothetical protein n=1 Tax=Chryseobacterium sp. SIMBA_028 TaxID=3085771 RepID=UPI00397C537C
MTTHTNRIEKEIWALHQADPRTLEKNIQDKVSSVLLFKDYITRLKAWKKVLQLEYIPLGLNINVDRNNVLMDIAPELGNEMMSYLDFCDYVFKILSINIPGERYKNGVFIYLYVYWQVFKDHPKVKSTMIQYPGLQHPYDGIIKMFRHDYIFRAEGISVRGLTMSNSGIYLPSVDDVFLDFIDRNCQSVSGFTIPEQPKVDELWQAFQDAQK